MDGHESSVCILRLDSSLNLANSSESASLPQALSSAQDMHMDSSVPDEITKTKTTTEYDKKNDLCAIPGLYRLLDLYKDVDLHDIKRLCDDIMPNSFKSISKINYKKLNSRSIRLVGCYGRNELIAKFLHNKNIISKENYEWINLSSADKLSREVMPPLRPGIYLQQVLSTEKVNPLFLVIHWSEDGCYDDSASSYRKKNMTNLHRYLTKLTDRQICLMSEHDLESVDFEVKESQEQKEDFKIVPGFQVNISGLEPRQAPRNDYLNNIPLNSFVVDSVSNQTFITREIVPETKSIKSDTISFNSTSSLREWFRSKLETQKCALIIDTSLKMSNLEVIVKDGLGLEEILKPYYDELIKLDQEKIRTKEQHEEKDTLLTERLAWHILKLKYSNFEEILHEQSDIIKEDEKNYIQQSYPEIVQKLEKFIDFIDYEPWINLKRRFILAKALSEKIAAPDPRPTFLKIFFDEELELKNLVKKWVNKSKSDMVKNIKKEASQILDSQFFKEISHDEEIFSAFYTEYDVWRNSEFIVFIETKKFLQIHSSTQFLQELDRDFSKKRHELEIREVDLICSDVNKKYPEGELLKIKGLEIKTYKIYEAIYNIMKYKYHLSIENEVLNPAKLKITIYETRISKEDSMELEKVDSFIPTPLLHSSGQNSGVSFEIDPQKYEIINISQFDKKFLVILWNKVKTEKKMELYFDSLQRLPMKINSQSPIKKLTSGPNSKIAINDSKGLIAVYRPNDAVLNVFGVDDDKTNLRLSYGNIQLKQYYNNVAPEITHFLFIKNTEDICFVENNGKAKIYSLIIDRFRPGIADFPSSAKKILSTPDGACIVVFTAVQEGFKDIELTDALISENED
ncbi:5558_t:CDS:10, partial [Funneliformis caledonium]